MKCQEFQKQIYLYRDLNSTERKFLDHHISQCDACNKLFDQISYTSELIVKARQMKPEIENPALLTERVMKAIELKPRWNLFDELKAYMEGYFLRYAVSLVSLLLITFFLYEQQAYDRQSRVKQNSWQLNQGVRFNMHDFSDTYRVRRANKNRETNSRYAHYKAQKESNRIVNQKQDEDYH